jgi:8-oxo-dGTP pyrophosphatase MutT (NUDIX family)
MSNPGENPVDTVRREVREELGIEAKFPTWIGERPLLLTVTQTSVRSMSGIRT